MNWQLFFNKIFELINLDGPTYFGGTRFLNSIRSVNDSVPNYYSYIKIRQEQGKSSSRRDYFFDLLMEQSETDRLLISKSILDEIEGFEPEKTKKVRDILVENHDIKGPTAIIPQDLWNSDRLIEYLERIDNVILEGNYEYALTLAYTCLEGFYKSFLKAKMLNAGKVDELPKMSVIIRDYIKTQLEINNIAYPINTVLLISTVTNAICNARNDFSDSHSGNKAEKWLAVYLRDNVNSIVKLILNFI